MPKGDGRGNNTGYTYAHIQFDIYVKAHMNSFDKNFEKSCQDSKDKSWY